MARRAEWVSRVYPASELCVALNFNAATCERSRSSKIEREINVSPQEPQNEQSRFRRRGFGHSIGANETLPPSFVDSVVATRFPIAGVVSAVESAAVVTNRALKHYNGGDERSYVLLLLSSIANSMRSSRSYDERLQNKRERETMLIDSVGYFVVRTGFSCLSQLLHLLESFARCHRAFVFCLRDACSLFSVQHTTKEARCRNL